jgi:hypothetical protein
MMYLQHRNERKEPDQNNAQQRDFGISSAGGDNDQINVNRNPRAGTKTDADGTTQAGMKHKHCLTRST